MSIIKLLVLFEKKAGFEKEKIQPTAVQSIKAKSFGVAPGNAQTSHSSV